MDCLVAKRTGPQSIHHGIQFDGSDGREGCGVPQNVTYDQEAGGGLHLVLRTLPDYQGIAGQAAYRVVWREAGGSGGVRG